MTEDAVNEVVEEEKVVASWHFDVQLGELSNRIEVKAESPNLRQVLAQAMGIPQGLVFLNDVFYAIEDDYWAQKLGVTFHVGPNSKAVLIAFVKIWRY